MGDKVEAGYTGGLDCLTHVAVPLGFLQAGFGADIGLEKFMNIKCRASGLKPDAAGERKHTSLLACCNMAAAAVTVQEAAAAASSNSSSSHTAFALGIAVVPDVPGFCLLHIMPCRALPRCACSDCCHRARAEDARRRAPSGGRYPAASRVHQP